MKVYKLLENFIGRPDTLKYSYLKENIQEEIVRDDRDAWERFTDKYAGLPVLDWDADFYHKTLYIDIGEAEEKKEDGIEVKTMSKFIELTVEKEKHLFNTEYIFEVQPRGNRTRIYQAIQPIVTDDYESVIVEESYEEVKALLTAKSNPDEKSR